LSKRYTVSISIAIIVLALDQISKYLVRQFLPLNHSIEVINGFFNLVHIQNPGIIFGIFSQSTHALRNYLLITGSLLAILFLLFFIRSLRERDFPLTVAISLILGGAIGNLVDRIIFEKVIDFLDFYWHSHHWPAFNMADSAITVGMVILVIQILRDESNQPSN